MPIVLLPVFNGYEAVEACLESLFRPQLDAAISKLLIIDDASTDSRIAALLESFRVLDATRVSVIRNPQNMGYLRSVNQCLTEIVGSVVLLNSDTVVCPHWVSRMVEGSKRYPRLALLTPLSNNGTFSTISDPAYLGSKLDLDDLPAIQAWCASRVGSAYPLAPTGMGFCLLMTELARSLVTGFDELFAPGYEEENDMAQRLRSYGLQCRIATDVFVFHQGGESFGKQKQALQAKHYQLIQRKHPTYDALIREWFSCLDYPYALVGESPRSCINLLLDCEVMRQSMTGVVRYITTLFGCFESSVSKGLFRLTALVTDQQTKDYWQPLFPWIEWILEAELKPINLYPVYDVYHVVNANISLDRVLHMQRHAARMVITIHDLIAYENPSYHDTGVAFVSYRQRLRHLASLSDAVLAISGQTRNDVLEQLDLNADRCWLFANPLLHLQPVASDAPVPHAPVNSDSEAFCLIVGTDFRHKHIPVTVELFRDYVLPVQPKMRLLIAGPSVETGGTSKELRSMLNLDPTLAASVRLLGPVSDDRLKQLYQQATLCFYLSLQEGFGYIPYEAAEHGCPTLVANTSVFSAFQAPIAISPYHCDDSRSLIERLVCDPDLRRSNLQFWLQRIQMDHGRDPAAELQAIYSRVLATPRASASQALFEVLSSSMDGSMALLAQTDLRREVRSVSRRVFSAAKRKFRSRLKRPRFR